MKPLTDDEIRIAIAEACGWKCYPYVVINGRRYEGPHWTSTKNFDPDNPPPGESALLLNNMPDYPNDLNAMHKAVMDLKSRNGKAYMRYQQELIRQDGFLYPDATARQRCLAFLKVTAGQKGSE